MKKLSTILLVILSITLILSSCSSKKNVTYAKMDALWTIYSDANQLVDAADLVFIGKLTDISFTALDINTGLEITEKTEDSNRSLYTLYHFDVIETYKGDTSQVTYFMRSGGLENYKTDEQLKVVKENNVYGWEEGIRVWEDAIEYEIGETYLFTLCKREGVPPLWMNLYQSLYSIDDPLRKLSHKSDKIYYTEDKDEYGEPLISVKDIILEFGEEKWNEFATKYVKNN